jgi:2-oxoglutaroyl-CoA hydrolase
MLPEHYEGDSLVLRYGNLFGAYAMGGLLMVDYAEKRGELLKNLDGLRCEKDTQAKIGYVILDRPPVNVISYDGRRQIAALLTELDADPDVRVIVIRGANGAYCAGGDIRGFLSFPRDQMSDLAQNIGMPERCRKPVIAAMEKYSMGAGFELALACDVRIATENTQLALPEITLGIIPGSGGTQRLARIAGLGRAKDMLMRGRRIGAQEAHDWGIVAEVVPDGGLDDAIARWAGELGSMASFPMTTLKRVLNETYETPISTGFHLEGQAFEKLRPGPEFKYGIECYLEKRKPDYSNM